MADQSAPINEAILMKTNAPDSENNNNTEGKTLKKLFESAKLARSPYDAYWDQRWDYYKGKQWPGTVKKPVMNIIRSTIQTILPLLTDAKPGVNIFAAEPNDFEIARIFQHLVETWWEKPEVSMSHTLIEPLTDMCIYDAGFLKIYWDPEAENGSGDVRVKSIAPSDIFVNKEAIDFDKNCYYVIERQYITVAWLKSRFPEFAPNIKSSTQLRERQTNSSMSEVTVQGPIETKQPVSNNTPIINITDQDCRETAQVWEIWIDSAEMEAYETKDESGAVKESGQRRKYPNGRLLTFLPDQNLILQSVDNPYKHGKKPYVRFVDSLMPHCFWGEGEAEPLMNAQNNINLTLSNILSYLKLMSNPVWKLTSDSGVRREDITNDVALVLETDPNHIGDVIRDIPPAMQAGIFDLYSMMMKNGEIESGVNDSTQGRRPIGVTSGDAIEALQESAYNRIRLKERNMQVSLSKLGSMLIQLFMQYYSTPRVVRLTGIENVWPTYFEFYFKPTEDGQYQLLHKKMKYDTNSNSYTSPGYIESKPTAGIFDVRIASGTSQPIQKAQRTNLAFKLAQMRLISKESLLKAIEWPDMAEELDRDRQAAAEQPPQGPAPTE